MPVNTANGGSTMSAKRNSTANDFNSEYNKLIQKTSLRGGKITEEEEFQLNKYQNIDK
jgi:hypothetical protein